MTDLNKTRFKPVDSGRHGTTAEEITVQLRGMIHRGELRPGDRLPPERDLAKMLRVSRPTLRAGISSLAGPSACFDPDLSSEGDPSASTTNVPALIHFRGNV